MPDREARQYSDTVRPPRRARWLFRGLLAAPVLFALVAGAIWWTQGRIVARRLQAIRDRGQPVTAEDLEAFYTAPPPEQDATALWTAAGINLEPAGTTALAKQLPFIGAGLDPPPPGQPWKELPLAEQFLADNAAAMQLLHDAAAKGGGARYDYDFSQGFNVLLPEVQKSRHCARCLALEATVRAHRGDAAGAADSLRTGMALARSMENEPFLVSQLVRNAIQETMDAQLKKLLPATDFSDADLAGLQDELLATDFQPALSRAMMSERSHGDHVV